MIDPCSIETKGLISIDRALQIIKESVTSIKNQNQRVILKNALGRILATSVYSQINIPPDTNSAMDGYAFSSSEIISDQSFNLTLVGTSWAGEPYQGTIKKGECVRIFTGAVIPNGADSVMMQEYILKNERCITFPATTVAKQNIRKIGSDIEINSTLLTAPKKLSAIDIGLLASAGVYDVIVTRKLKIAFFSTGNELCAIGQKLKQGQIYDSNRYTLAGLLDNNSYTIYDLGVVVDNKKKIKELLLAAAKTNDVIISTGGASVGEADYIKEILDECGQVNFWKIAIKPGKPLAFGKINNCYFFGLPGNPVSVIATFHKIVNPALHYLTGLSDRKTIQLTAVCTNTLKKEKGRQEYQRGILSQKESGEFFVSSAGKQGSNIMSAMSKANCYIVLPIDCTSVSAGQKVEVEPFDTLL